MEFGTIYCTVLPVSNPENPLLGAGRRLSLLAFYPRGAVGFPHRSPRGFTLPLQLSPQAAPERPSLGRLSGGKWVEGVARTWTRESPGAVETMNLPRDPGSEPPIHGTGAPSQTPAGRLAPPASSQQRSGTWESRQSNLMVTDTGFGAQSWFQFLHLGDLGQVP